MEREIIFEYGFQSVNGIVKKQYHLHEIPNIANLCDVWNQLPIVYVRQFTGLLDKNGKKIFEGDVYKRLLDKANAYEKTSEWADYWFVSWIAEDCCFTTTCIANNVDGKFVNVIDWRSKINPFSKRFKEFDEYVGNLHDNPELLTPSKG